MKVTNPSDVEIRMTFEGTNYSIPAKGTEPNIPAHVAEHWKTRVHEFIVVEPETTEEGKVATKKEEKVEEVEEKVPVTKEVKK